VEGVIIVIVTVKEGILLLGNAKLRSIAISFPAREGTIKFRILPIDRKDCFAFKLLVKDREVTRCINTTDTAMIFRAVLVTMPGSMTVATDEVLSGSVVTMVMQDAVEGVGDAEHSRLCVVVSGGEGADVCNTCSMGGSGRASTW
jgi:hypothetical protein